MGGFEFFACFGGLVRFLWGVFVGFFDVLLLGWLGFFVGFFSDFFFVVACLFLTFWGKRRFGVFCLVVVVGVRIRVCWYLCSKPIGAFISIKIVI